MHDCTVPCTTPISTTNLQKNCNSTNTGYSVSFTINGGTPPYTVDGISILGNTFTSTSFNNNAPYNFLIDDANVACPSINVSGMHDCTVPCTTPISTTNLQKNCNSTNTGYTVSFTINGGTPPYTVDGTAVLGNTFTSTSFNNNALYNFLIDDANIACSSINVSGTHDCTVPCPAPISTITLLEECNPANTAYSVSFTIVGGVPPYTVDGQTITGAAFFSNNFTNNVPYSYVIDDSNSACAAITVSGAHDCTVPCTTQISTGNLLETCNSSNTGYTVSFTINGGLPPYSVNGQVITGNTFTSNNLNNNALYNFLIDDTNGTCPWITLQGTHTCSVPCANAPVAMSDTFSLTINQLHPTFNVAKNDQLFDKVTYELLSPPTLGQLKLKQANLGIFEYNRTTNDLGNTQFQYRVCNDACPSDCSQATVYLSLLNATSIYGPEGLILDDPENGIYYIPRLDKAPCDCPNNEFYVINRWGAVVYSAKPFDNTKGWNGHAGKDDTYGAALPAGTYYKLIKINIGNGEIHTGVITIVEK
jgi:hypothetical protein